MRHWLCTLAGATALLIVGTPTQARYGGPLLGSGTHSGGGSAHTPAHNSAERRAIMDALRLKVGKASGKYVVFNVQRLRVSRGWAWALVRPQSPSGKTHYDPIGALLHKHGGRWTVTHTLEGDSLTTDPATLQAKYPDASPGIF
ncbi:MAG: hypothetical protein JO250_04850 [Armatimonadetes bacterium]|nr:hypothetical protein [Armatimonadota bacterium]